MIGLIARRVLTIVPIAFVVGTITFLIMHISPGDPVAVMLGPEATPDQIERARDRLGLDEPLVVQYPKWLGQLARLDFGESLFLRRSVSSAIFERVTPTLQLTTYALVVALGVGIPAGLIAGWKANSLIDRLLMLLAVAGTAIADFFLAILFVLLFAVTLHWLPSGGYVGFTADPVQHVRSMILPSLALGLSLAGLPARLVRSSLLDVMHEDYIRTAFAKGLPTMVVATRHALRNALIPAIATVGYTLGDLLGGAVVVETVFNMPGMGQLVINSIARRDFPVIQGVVMVCAAFFIIGNLLADLATLIVDPRLRHAHVD